MRKWLILALIPGAFFATQLNAQTLRIDAILSGSGSFKSEMEQREKFSALIGGQMNGDWTYAGGAGLGPVSLSYLHAAGPGRLYLGGSYQGYNYTAEHTDISLLAGGIRMATVEEYSYSMGDVEVGYEIKSGKVTITPKIGNRSYSKTYSNSSMDLGLIFSANSLTHTGDASGLYAGLGFDVDLNDKVAFSIEGITSAGPMKGSAERTFNSFGSALGLGYVDVGTASMDMEVEFVSARAGIKLKGSNGFSVKFGVQYDEFKTGYPNQFTFGVGGGSLYDALGISGPYMSGVTDLLIYNPILWEKKYSDTRTGLFVGLTKDIDF